MKLKNLKKAVAEYKRLNAGGPYDPFYGYLMLDTETGEMWTDEFYSLGHNSWKQYEKDSIINLGETILYEDPYADITVKTVQEYVDRNF